MFCCLLTRVLCTLLLLATVELQVAAGWDAQHGSGGPDPATGDKCPPVPLSAALTGCGSQLTGW